MIIDATRASRRFFESGREGCLGGPLRQGLTRPIFFGHQMYLLYLDESGDPQNRDEKHFVLGGLADFIAWSVFRRYERGDTRFFDRLVQRFDCEGPRIHGLYHRTREHYGCFCAACLSRRASSAEA